MIRSTTTRETEWDEQERAWMLALVGYEAGLCPSCGRHLSICTDPAIEGKVSAGLPSRCYYTTAVEIAREPYMGGKAKHAGALLFSAEAQSG